MKILEIVWENRMEFIEKCMLIMIWWLISIEQLKLSNLPAKFCAFGPKWREFWKFSRKFWDFLIQISMENWLFSQFFTKYFLDFLLRSESIYLWKITPDFYNKLSDFGGGTFRRSPPPLPDPTASPRMMKQWALAQFGPSGHHW